MSLTLRSYWMLAVSGTFGLYAVLWATAAFPTINLPARFILDVSNWPLNQINEPLSAEIAWITSIAAGLLAAVAIFLAMVVVPAIRKQDLTIIRATHVAMISWYLIDGIGSIAAGVVSNVVFNTLYLAVTLLPLVGISQVENAETKEE